MLMFYFFWSDVGDIVFPSFSSETAPVRSSWDSSFRDFASG